MEEKSMSSIAADYLALLSDMDTEEVREAWWSNPNWGYKAQQQQNPPPPQYAQPIGPTYEPPDPAVTATPRGGPPRYVIDPVPQYNFRQVGLPAQPTALQTLGRGAATVGHDAGRFAWDATSGGAKWVGRQIAKKWDAHQEYKKTQLAMGPGVPEYVVREVVAIKKQYSTQPNSRGLLDDIDRAAKEEETRVRDNIRDNSRNFQLQLQTIQQRFQQVGTKQARQQGRREAWGVVKATPRIAFQAFADEAGKVKRSAQDIRDRQLQARQGAIQQHQHAIQTWREQYLGQLKADVRQRVGEALEVFYPKGKARNFREVMRNKAKVRDRHLLAYRRGQTQLPVTHADKRLLRDLMQMPDLPKGRRNKITLPDPRYMPGLGKRAKSSRTLKQWNSRQRQMLRKYRDPRMTKNVREEYYGKHPVVHSAGSVISSPVMLPYKAGRGTVRFTGLNELPQIARDKHAALKHEFIHDFLLR